MMERETSWHGKTGLEREKERIENYKEALAAAAEKLAPLAVPLKKPRRGDWLAEHHEDGQTFRQYVNSNPIRASTQRNKIYITPLGKFNDAQQKILDCAAEFLSTFYGLSVHVEESSSIKNIPPKAQRIHPEWDDHQILTSYIRRKLIKHLPSDAATYICFTTSDLWPGRGWNFVFGEASLIGRVGVWSMYRYGDPSKSPVEFNRCLQLVLKTMVHEVGHMFGMHHCIAYNNCGMRGSNHLKESASIPIHFCPECTPKVAWATGIDLVDRAQKLSELCQKYELTEYASYYAQSHSLLSK